MFKVFVFSPDSKVLFEQSSSGTLSDALTLARNTLRRISGRDRVLVQSPATSATGAWQMMSDNSHVATVSSASGTLFEDIQKRLREADAASAPDPRRARSRTRKTFSAEGLKALFS